jgi:branched-chain amino acid transport system substrate-binding protein
MGSALAQSPGARPVLHVGYVIDSTGPFVDASRDFFTGSKVLFDDLTSRGQLRQVRISQRTTDGSPARTRAAVLELARIDRVDVVLGPVGDAALLALMADPEFVREGVPLVGPVSGVGTGHPLVGQLVFFTRPDYGQEVAFLMRHLTTMGIPDVTLLVAPSTPPEVAALARSALTQTISGAATRRLSETTLPVDSAQWPTTLARLAQAKPRALLLIGDSVAYAQTYQELRRLLPATFVVGLSTVNPRTMLELMPAAQLAGAILTQVVHNPARTTLPVTRDFDRAMKRFFDEPASHQSMEGYVAAHMLLAAHRRIDAAGRERLRAALSAVDQVELGGFGLSYPTRQARGSAFVDLMMVRANGQFMQ